MSRVLSSKVVSIDSGNHRAKVLERRDKLAAQHFHLVRPIAERIQKRLPPSFELEDLIQNGHLGLLRAATLYDPKNHNNTPFDAYARKFIHGNIVEFARRRHYTENTRPGIEETYEQTCEAPNVECIIDRKRKLQRIALSRSYLSNEQAAVFARYYSADQPSLAQVAADLGIPEWRAVKAHSEALAFIRNDLKVA